jgi:hypothetical protein
LGGLDGRRRARRASRVGEVKVRIARKTSLKMGGACRDVAG